LFVLTHDPETVKKSITEFKKEVPVNLIVKTPNQWGELEIKEPEFYNEVNRGIKLFKDD